MTFEEWKATRQYAADLGSVVEADVDGRSGYHYAHGAHIEARGSRFGVIIGNTEEEFDTLEAAELYLWEEWARDETNGGEGAP